MPESRPSGSELFIVDNADADWKVCRYLHDWCDIARALDIATGYFEIGPLLALVPPTNPFLRDLLAECLQAPAGRRGQADATDYARYMVWG